MMLKSISILIILSMIGGLVVSGQQTTTQWSVNGHFYRSYPNQANPVTYQTAMTNCSSDTTSVPGSTGYLVTINSLQEWNFMFSSGIITKPGVYWVSGSQTSNLGVYTYSTGPESGQQFYSLLTDSCSGGCPFSTSGPILKSSEGFIYTTYDENGNYWLDNSGASEGNVYSWVCEYGGLELPFVPQIGVNGGQVTITNVGGFANPTQVAAVFQKDNVNTTCTTNTLTSSQLTCTLPTMSGFYNVTITDGVTSKTVIGWHVTPASLGAVYPGKYTNDRVTLLGANFGKDSTKISITISNDKIPCTNVNILYRNGNDASAISCVLQSNVFSNFLPIQISIDQVQSQLFKTPIFCIDRFYQILPLDLSIQDTRTNTPLFKIGSQNSTIATITSQPLYNCLNTTLAYKSSGWDVWVGASYSPTSGEFTISDGPFTGKSMNVYNTKFNVSAFNPAVPLAYNLATAELYSYTGGSTLNTLFQYGGLPKFINNITTTLPTTGRDVGIAVDDAGTFLYFDSLVFKVGNKTAIAKSIQPQISQFIFNLTIPEGYNQMVPMVYTIDGRSTAPNTQFITYQPPTVTSVTNNVTSSGGYFTITGTNFYSSTDPSVLVISLSNGLLCSLPEFVVPHTQLRCLLSAGSGKQNGTISIGTQSAPFAFEYAPPTITNVKPNGDVIVVDGNSFGSVANLIVADFAGTITCTNITITVPHKQFSCQIPSTTNPTMTITFNLNVNTQSTSFQTSIPPAIKGIDKKPFTSGGNILITGRYLSGSYYSFKPFNSTTIPLTCTNGNSIGSTCTIPSGINTFDLIVGSSTFNTTYSTSYQPPIVQLSSSLKQNQPGTISIIGKSFGQSSNSIQVSIQSIVCSNVNLLNNSLNIGVDQQTITCLYDSSIPSPTNQSSLVVTVKVGTLIGSNQVFIYSQQMECPNNCSGHGQCNLDFGDCQCDQGYQTSIDCSMDSSISVQPPLIQSNGITKLYSQLNFSIGVQFIREVAVDGTYPKTLNLDNIQWTELPSINQTKIYNGTFTNDPVQVELQITSFENGSSISFAGQPMSMPSNSVKYEIKLTNWAWVSKLDNIQIVFLTKTDGLAFDQCGNQQSNIVKSPGSSLYWSQIAMGSSILNTKFSSRIINDDRIMTSIVNVLDNNDQLYKQLSINNSQLYLLTALSSPSFSDSLLLDPSFSSVSLGDQIGDGCDKKFETWKIATIAAGGAVGLALVATVGILFLKKKNLAKPNKSTKLSKIQQSDSTTPSSTSGSSTLASMTPESNNNNSSTPPPKPKSKSKPKPKPKSKPKSSPKPDPKKDWSHVDLNQKINTTPKYDSYYDS